MKLLNKEVAHLPQQWDYTLKLLPVIMKGLRR